VAVAQAILYCRLGITGPKLIGAGIVVAGPTTSTPPLIYSPPWGPHTQSDLPSPSRAPLHPPPPRRCYVQQHQTRTLAHEKDRFNGRDGCRAGKPHVWCRWIGRRVWEMVGGVYADPLPSVARAAGASDTRKALYPLTLALHHEHLPRLGGCHASALPAPATRAAAEACGMCGM